jgi:hypothetical protein
MLNARLATEPAFDPAFGYDMEDTIKLARLQEFLAADIIGDIEVVGRVGGWVIRVHTGDPSPPVLAAPSGAIRLFTSADSAIQQLLELGITRVQFVADDLDLKGVRAPRVDREALARQQAEHDARITAKACAVRDRLRAGTEPTISSEEILARYGKHRRKD